MKSILLAWAAVGLAAGLAGCASTSDRGSAGELAVRHVDADGAAAVLSREKPVVLDVRTPKEFEAGHLAGAMLVDFKGLDFEKNLAALDREQEYLVYCRSGGRSGNALEAMKRLGFKRVVHLDGGFLAWEGAGKPVVK